MDEISYQLHMRKQKKKNKIRANESTQICGSNIKNFSKKMNAYNKLVMNMQPFK